jgi:putative flippase GtrA
MNRSALSIVAAYIMFCVIATVVNLGVQWVLIWISLQQGLDQRQSWLIAISGGTMAGLAIKYVLDKTYIFEDRSADLGAHARKFSLYTAMGLVTTAIFWCAEAVAFMMFPTSTGMLVGGGIGLAVGYVIKYHLDRRFVFEVTT